MTPFPYQGSSTQLEDFDPVELYAAIADFEVSEESSISLAAGQHVQVGGAMIM